MTHSVVAAFAAALTGISVLAGPAPIDRRLAGPDAGAVVQSDLDAFMKKVLASRDENWKKLQQYVLDEHEQIEVRGPAKVPVWGERRDYTWYIREGFFIRSPIKVNGVTVSEGDRRKAEDNYLKSQKERDKRRARGEPPSAPRPAADPAEDLTPKDVATVLQTRQPEFVESAYFLRFKFEQGKYALVGRETFDGLDVLKIEYYPAKLFTHEQDQQQRREQQKRTDREKDVDAAVERMMNKVSLVTLWVEPKAFQVVKYTFDNVNADFLPAAWLVRISDAKASMTMNQPFKDVWLPRDVDIYVQAMLAIGSFDAHYRLDYHDYRQAETSSRIKAPEGR